MKNYIKKLLLKLRYNSCTKNLNHYYDLIKILDIQHDLEKKDLSDHIKRLENETFIILSSINEIEKPVTVSSGH